MDEDDDDADEVAPHMQLASMRVGEAPGSSAIVLHEVRRLLLSTLIAAPARAR